VKTFAYNKPVRPETTPPTGGNHVHAWSCDFFRPWSLNHKNSATGVLRGVSLQNTTLLRDETNEVNQQSAIVRGCVDLSSNIFLPLHFVSQGCAVS
jgi:hypothetical protein